MRPATTQNCEMVAQMSHSDDQNPLNPSAARLRERIESLEKSANIVPKPTTDDAQSDRSNGILLQNLGFRVASDLLAGILVGVVIGMVMDHYLPTRPWGFIGFFILGSLAGMLNVWRAIQPRQTDAKPPTSPKS